MLVICVVNEGRCNNNNNNFCEEVFSSVNEKYISTSRSSCISSNDVTIAFYEDYDPGEVLLTLNGK